MKRHMLAVLMLVAMVACNNADNADNNSGKPEITVTHELGETKVKQTPERVVVFDLGILETLDELGIKPVGMPKAHLTQYLNKYKDDPVIADVGALLEINFEKVNAQHPDLIIISARQKDSYAELSKIAPTVYLAIDNKDYIASFEKNTRTIGEIFNKKEAVEKELKVINEQLAAQKAQNENRKEKALIVMYNNGKFSAYGSKSRFGFVHDFLGLPKAVDSIDVAQHGQPVSSEFIEKANPDFLFVVDRGAVVSKKAAVKEEIENKLIQQTNAYKNGKIIYLDPEVWYLSGSGIYSVKQMISSVAEAIK